MSARKSVRARAQIFVVATVLGLWTRQAHSQPQSQDPQQSTSNQKLPGMQMPNEQQQHEQDNIQGMDHKHIPGLQMNMEETPKTFVGEITRHGTSGTSAVADLHSRADAHDDEGQVDADVPRRGISQSAATERTAWLRQGVFDQLVHADGAAPVGAGHLHNARDAQLRAWNGDESLLP